MTARVSQWFSGGVRLLLFTVGGNLICGR